MSARSVTTPTAPAGSTTSAAKNYNLPGYFGGKRWTYYRLQNRSHNTLEIDGKLQNAKSKPCPLTASSLTGNPAHRHLRSHRRLRRLRRPRSCAARVSDPHRESSESTDEITAPSGDVVWRAFTDADCEIKGDLVILTKRTVQITLRRISSGTWSITDAKPPTPEENQNKDFRAVVLTVPKADRFR